VGHEAEASLSDEWQGQAGIEGEAVGPEAESDGLLGPVSGPCDGSVTKDLIVCSVLHAAWSI